MLSPKTTVLYIKDNTWDGYTPIRMKSFQIRGNTKLWCGLPGYLKGNNGSHLYREKNCVILGELRAIAMLAKYWNTCGPRVQELKRIDVEFLIVILVLQLEVSRHRCDIQLV